jgi:hypothetical protein
MDAEPDVDGGTAFRRLGEMPKQLSDGNALQRVAAQFEEQHSHLGKRAAVQATHFFRDPWYARRRHCIRPSKRALHPQARR